ncbi:Phosphate acetyltransferase [Aquisphaera giovannonii]|uniref:Phosphate acetyltransferase n=1 Tax=Aquisphaera giovannonii TaxID=406548 RepID=A0A5B9W0D7_9BACT|nr:phosphate acyltransferase [Aquisphaera giovannonii]QEH33664.1 Phosphate acetyltransferase [Aquisphaera giovannonii]
MSGLPSFERLFGVADARGDAATLAVAGGDDPTVIEAMARARDRGWIRPILVGPEHRIRQVAADIGIDMAGMQIVHAEGGDVASSAVSLVRSGRARALMKGQIATASLMRAVLDASSGLRTGRVICQVALVEIPRDGRRFLLADTGITIRPDLEQKIGIATSAIDVSRALGVASPRVAIMAASESINPAMPETIDARDIAGRLNEGGEISCEAQGPLSFDLAYADDAGAQKQIGGSVVGKADAMIFPDLNSANLTVKAIMYTADCHFGGILMGCSCPVVFMSRADDVSTRMNSLALTLAVLDDPRRKTSN